MTGQTSPLPSHSSPRPADGWKHEAATASGMWNMKNRLGVALVMMMWLWLGVAGLTTLPLSIGWSWVRGTRLPDAAWALFAILGPPTAALLLVAGSLGSMIVMVFASLEFVVDCVVHGYRFALLHGVLRR